MKFGQRIERMKRIFFSLNPLKPLNPLTLAALEDRIRDYGVEAVSVGSTVNPALAQRVAEDTGIKLVFLFTGSLTEPGGEADSYLGYVKYNVGAIVEGLRQGTVRFYGKNER